MTFVKEQIFGKVDTVRLSQFVGLASLTLFVPFFIPLQWISGPIVNAILIITLYLVGIRSAMLLCLVPSLMALSSGLLPAVLAPVVPFIMISNVILILAVDYFHNNVKSDARGFVYGVLAGALLKFLFLTYSTSLVADLLINNNLIYKVAQLFSYTQFITAITGGGIAWIVLKFLKRL